MRIIKFNKHIKRLLILLYGIQYSNLYKVSLDIISDLNFQDLLYEDDFGVYKKENVKIPHKYKKAYKRYKRYREELIYAKYYKFNIFVKFGLCKQYYLYENTANLSISDKIEVEKLLSKG